MTRELVWQNKSMRHFLVYNSHTNKAVIQMNKWRDGIEKKTCHHQTIWHILETRNVSVLVDDMAHSLNFSLLHCLRCLGSDFIANEAKKKKTTSVSSPQKNLRLGDVLQCWIGAFSTPLRASGKRSARGGACGRGMPAAACRWQAGLSHLLLRSGVCGVGGSGAGGHVYGENALFNTSLPRPSLSRSEKKTKPLIFLYSRRQEKTLEEREYAVGMTCKSGRVGVFCFFFWSEPCFHHASPSSFVTRWAAGWKELSGRQAKGRGQVGREEGREKKTNLQFSAPRRSAGVGWEHTRTADALGKQVTHSEGLEAFLIPTKAACSRGEYTSLFIS